MKKKLFPYLIISSMSLSIYSANVVVRNYTNEKVFARINNQRRSLLFGPTEWDILEEKILKIAFFPVYIMSEPILAAYRATAGYPNFIPIEPDQLVLFTTAPRRFRIKELRPFQTTLGAPIKTITFIRIIGKKIITGMLFELQNRVKDLANKYGNIELKKQFLVSEYTLTDELSKNKAGLVLVDPHQNYSITIPEIEEFTYTLPSGGIKKGIVDLKSWGDAIFRQAPQ